MDQLPGVTRTDNGRYWRFTVVDKTFGYLWEPTRTVGLKQTIAEQLALVAERPETFEVQFTAGGFGLVVVRDKSGPIAMGLEHGIARPRTAPPG